MANLNENDIRIMMHDADTRADEDEAEFVVPVAPPTTDENGEPVPDGLPQRNILVVACGDGGCNIGDLVVDETPNDAYVISYNSSLRNLKDLKAHSKLWPINPDTNSRRRNDGTGKSRDYSKQIFRSNYEAFIGKVNEAIQLRGNFDYAVVVCTADGGTGSGMGPMVAKLLQDNNPDMDIVICGVYPDKNNDAQSSYNTLTWQGEVSKLGLHYAIFDNSMPEPPANMTDPSAITHWVHNEVNHHVADLIAILAGRDYGNTTISIIDNANLRRLVNIPGRMVAATSKVRPSAGQTLDAYVENMLMKSCQPIPTHCTGIGMWIKAPVDIARQLDEHLVDFQEKYGHAQVKFDHVEYSDDGSIAISILLTGCNEASDRIVGVRHHYDDIMSQAVTVTAKIDDATNGLVNPMGEPAAAPVTRPDPGQMDLSALDL